MSPILNVAIPIFALIAAGYAAGRLRLLGEGGAVVLNAFVYYIALPALVLSTLSTTPLAAIANMPYLAAITGAQLGVFGAALLMASVLFPAGAGSLSQHALCAVLANSAYIGIPMMQLALGNEAALLAILAALVNAVFFMALGALLVALDRDGSEDRTGPVPAAAMTILRDPLVIAGAIGIALSAIDLRLPPSVELPLFMLGDAAGPAALVAIGVFLAGKHIGEDIAEVSWIAFIKLAMLPVVTWLVTIFLIPLSPMEQATAVLMAALPTSNMVFLVAGRWRVFLNQAVSAVVVTTALSVVTVSGLLAWFLPRLFTPV